MKFRFLTKKFFSEDAAENDKNPKPDKILIFVILGAVFLLFLSSFTGDNKNKEKESYKAGKSYTDTARYVADAEKRLSETLKKINGAGDVSVFISTEDGGEKVLAADTKEKSVRKGGDENEVANENSVEKSIVTADDGRVESPYVIEEKFPSPDGILVVASGARDEKVKFEIYDAVKAIYGLSAHRIKVTY